MAIDLGARADIDAARRLLHEQQRRLDPEPLAERDLLLIAAGKLAGVAAEAIAGDLEERGEVACQLDLRLRLSSAADGDPSAAPAT